MTVGEVRRLVSTLQGRTLGRYRLDTLLGRGGMAEVWRATDERLGRSVAVKVILAQHATEPQFLERFLREARLVASLEHPNILPIYDFGEENGLPFLVMPYMEGGTLRDRMLGKPVELPLAATWIRQLAGALDAAHEAGVLHRDVKPANVLLGKGDRIALADFGIAKMLETASGLTATGVVVGTPLYMAPEQAQGKPASPATDRYALAVLAYELLAGAPPFAGDNPLSVMHQHVATPPPVLSSKVGGLPAGLDAVFTRALSKDPAERPPTSRAFADAIASFLPTGMLPLPHAHVAWSPATPTPPPPPSTAPTVVRTPTPVPPRGAAPPTVPWNDSTPTEPHAPTPAPARTPAPPAALTSAPTVVAGGAAPSKKPVGLGMLAGAAAVVVLGAALLWRSSRRVEPPVVAPAPTSAPTAPPLVASEPKEPPPPAVTVVETPAIPGASAAGLPAPREAAAERATRLGALTKAVDQAIARGALLPPQPGNALEAVIALKSEFPREPESRDAQRRFTRALQRSVTVKVPDVDAARRQMEEAQKMIGNDEDIRGELRRAQAALRERPVPPAPPELPSSSEGEDEEPATAALGGLHRRLDASSHPEGRVSREDFEAVRNAARALLAENPGRADARSLQLYAEGGIAYAEGRDQDAARMLVAAVQSARLQGRRELRGLIGLLRRPGGGAGMPSGWELALAYGDARGEAQRLLDADLARNPADVRALIGRAYWNRLHHRDDASIADAQKAYDAAGGTQAGSAAAEFLGDAWARRRNWPESLRWLQAALKSPGANGGFTALRAGRIARDRLGRGDEAAELFRTGCRLGNAEACREAGENPPAAGERPGPLQRRRLRRG